MSESSPRACLGALFAIALAACSAADGSTLIGGSPHGATTTPGGSGSANGGVDGGSSSSSSGPSTPSGPSNPDAPGGADASSPPQGGSDAGGASDSGGAGDAGSPGVDAAPPANAFTGTGAYASNPPNTQAQNQHGFSLAGRDCFDCHGPNGGAPTFLFGGRVFADANGATPAADVEVRVADANGTGASAHSDQSGYFWYRGNPGVTFPAMAGARNASATLLMATTLGAAGNGGCNGCHDGKTQAYVHVP